MQAFIQQVADFLQHKFQGNYREVAVIFPGMRPGRRLLSELLQRHDQPTWAPSVFSLEGLMFDLYGMPPSDEILLLHTLYEVFYPNPEVAPETFSQFISKGSMLLRDFDELDRYLLDSEDLFRIIRDEKEIEARFNLHHEPELVEALLHFMGGIGESRTDDQQTLLHFWEQLPMRYAQFKSKLEERGLAYTGMIYRSLAGQLETLRPLSQYRHVVLAGFNALSTGEEAFFDYWQKEGKAWFCWDADRYFLDDASQEAGTFLRQYVQRFPPAIPFADWLGPYHRSRPEPASTKSVRLIGLPLHQSMARFLPSILEGIPAQEHHETAIVLPDEQLCLSVLQSLTPGSYNVTMGFPVNQSKAAHFLQLLLGFWRYQAGDEGILPQQARDFLLHPWTSALLQAAGFQDRTQEPNRLLSPPILDNPAHPLYLPLAPGFGQAEAELGQRLLQVFRLIPTNLITAPDQAFLMELEPGLRRLSGLVKQSGFRPPITEWLKLLPEVLENRKLAFETDTEGLQVCGLLETRGLQFRHLIVLSMNEGIVPRSGGSPSFLPYALRKAVGLPTADERAGLSAYYLLRLLGGADSAALLFNQITESSKAEEPSRFIAQLKEESWLRFSDVQAQLPVSMAGSRSISVPRSEATKALMAKFLEGRKAFTPKHLNEWLDCKLKFWWSSVLRIPEMEEELPQADNRFLGSALHKVMEWLFASPRKAFTEAETAELPLQNLIQSAFKEVYWGETTSVPESFVFNGEFKLLQAVCERMIRTFLQMDLQEPEFSVVGVEKKLELPFDLEEHPFTLKLGGNADRVQMQQGKAWIIDYKTGKSEKASEDPEVLFEREADGRPHYGLQTLWYAWLQLEMMPEVNHAGAKLYYMRSPDKSSKNGLIVTYDGFSRTDENGKLAFFKEHATRVLSEIVLDESPFTQCENVKICQHCPYKAICRR